MDTTSSSRSIEAAARRLPWQRALGIALLAAGLSGAPLLARSAAAQRPATIQASANIINSYITTGLRADSATVAPAAASPNTQPAARQLRIAGLGVLDINSGSGTSIRVVSHVAEVRGLAGTTVQVSVTYLGN